MKEKLAKKLVADLMDWDVERATNEFSWLELMVNYKFNDYQQYGPGHRFYVHLLRWLSQYPAADRERVWKLLREQLIYVSQEDMHHLVSLTDPAIEREMRAAVARRLSIHVYQVDERCDAQRLLAEMRCRTLYVGVSDGARIDVFRRYNEGLVNNEQVVAMVEISKSKQKKLLKTLKERLDAMKSSAPATFEWVCLIDDFTASGTTSIRLEDDGSWSGKVDRFMQEVAPAAGEAPLISADVHVQVHHYLASQTAKNNVTQRLAAYATAHPALRFIPSFSYVLPQDIVVSAKTHPELAALLAERYDPGIETKHTGTGIALGYKDGGLPLVLDHNTPNNSLATLWATSETTSPKHQPDKLMSALFPRRQRHSDVRP
ncbi:MAG: hypothetical protein KF720_03175 [Rubrivivax sp.]|nr:hypothetical protein [Rubrivivax sp.]